MDALVAGSSLCPCELIVRMNFEAVSRSIYTMKDEEYFQY